MTFPEAPDIETAARWLVDFFTSRANASIFSTHRERMIEGTGVFFIDNVKFEKPLLKVRPNDAPAINEAFAFQLAHRKRMDQAKEMEEMYGEMEEMCGEMEEMCG